MKIFFIHVQVLHNELVTSSHLLRSKDISCQYGYSRFSVS